MPGFFSKTATADKPQAKQRPTIPPIITEEADRAIFAILKKYGFLSFALAVLCFTFDIIFASRYPHSKLFKQYGVFYDASVCLWLVPFFIGQNKQSALRLKYGREYIDQGRWKEAAAALGSFAEFGQKSFDRTGEAHYLLAMAQDKLGRKEKAEKSRQFVIKHRSGMEWAAKLASASQASAPTSAASVRRKAIDQTGELVARKPAAGQTKGRRRRF
jgi:hypothetical protein